VFKQLSVLCWSLYPLMLF